MMCAETRLMTHQFGAYFCCTLSSSSVHLLRAADVNYTKRRSVSVTVPLLPDTQVFVTTTYCVYVFRQQCIVCALPIRVQHSSGQVMILTDVKHHPFTLSSKIFVTYIKVSFFLPLYMFCFFKSKHQNWTHVKLDSCT